jgi:hypothetical protein
MDLLTPINEAIELRQAMLGAWFLVLVLVAVAACEIVELVRLWRWRRGGSPE